jgi:sugar phosphate isomerase/epimerase
MKFKIGILIDCLLLPLDQSLEKAREFGADGVQIYAAGRFSLLEMSLAERRMLKKRIDGLGLEVSALCGDLGGRGFEEASDNPEKIARSKRIVDLAGEFGTKIVTTHIGVIPRQKDARYKILLEAVKRIAAYCRPSGSFFAIETGPEPASMLREFIEEAAEPQLKVNFDPANQVMVQGENPAETVTLLQEFIVHTHAKDGYRIKPCDPVEIYNAFADNNPNGIVFDEYFLDLPLGRGDVPFPEYLKKLSEIGYDGYLTIEREAGTDRVWDIGEGVRFLRKLIG